MFINITDAYTRWKNSS